MKFTFQENEWIEGEDPRRLTPLLAANIIVWGTLITAWTFTYGYKILIRFFQWWSPEFMNWVGF